MSVIDARKVELHLTTFATTPPAFLINRAIECYGKCGCLSDARELFDEMSQRNGGSWNTMIMAYGKNGCAEEMEGLEMAFAFYVQARSSRASRHCIVLFSLVLYPGMSPFIYIVDRVVESSRNSTPVTSLDFHPNNGDLICSCDRLDEIQYWSVRNGGCDRVLKV
ncbi:hypothetical protein AgCh_017323 [Apium graveolens]